MTLLCKPIGPGNWAVRRFGVPGNPDFTLVGKRIEIAVPGIEHRIYWIRGVEP